MTTDTLTPMDLADEQRQLEALERIMDTYYETEAAIFNEPSLSFPQKLQRLRSLESSTLDQLRTHAPLFLRTSPSTP